MEPHPIRLRIEDDDLKRWRLTVFFRLILAIPHYFWLLGWSIAMVVAAVLQFVAALIMGRPANGLSRFLGSYTRYVTHLYAYLALAADPYPGFLGQPGYPVDLEIDEPEDPRQNRLTILFRFVLAIPALMLTGVLVGYPVFAIFGAGGGGSQNNYDSSGGGAGGDFSGGIIFGVAFLAWFACLATGRMPHGFQGLALYGLRYLGQTYAYLFMLTGRYPNSDPFDPSPQPSPNPQTVRILIEDDLQRSRLTVFFRLLLALPHFVWLALWGIVAFIVGFLNWIVTLVIGRSPSAFHRFLTAYMRYSTHVFAFVFLVANPFPGFTGTYGSYPIDLEIDPPARQHRLKTLFRGVLAIPAWFISIAFFVLLFVVGFLGWFAALVTGRMPLGFRNAGAYTIRYQAQFAGYWAYVITDRYPYTGPAERFGEPVEEEPGEPEPFEPAPAFAG